MPTVGELFERVGRQLDGPLGELFQGAAADMAAVAGRPPQTALRMQLEQVNLGREEETLLLELCGCLGRYDLSGQARALGLYKARLDGLIADSEEAIARRSRAWMTASVCSGLALIVILL